MDVVGELNKDKCIFSKLHAGHNTWSSKDLVRSWIAQNCTGSTNEKVDNNDNNVFCEQTCNIEQDVFLQLPDVNGGNNDDLELGAEAKHYSIGNQSMMSPRLSPIGSFDERELEYSDGSYLCESSTAVHDTVNSSVLSESNLKSLIISKLLIDVPNGDEISEEELQMPQLTTKSRQDQCYSVESCSTHDSITSSIDKPSLLAAALQTDPEELLYNLGFVPDSLALNLIPSRFFQQPSDAAGIDVEQIYQSLVAAETSYDDEIMEFEQPLSFLKSHCKKRNHTFNNGWATSSNPINHPRFSISSIECGSVVSLEAKRLLFQSSHQDLPSIFLSNEDNDRSNTPTTTSGSLSTNFMKLETLEEVPEPFSRNNSFENSRKPSFTETISNITERLHGLLSRGSSNESLKRKISSEMVSRQCSDSSCSRVDTLTSDTDTDSKHLTFKRERLSSKSSQNTIVNTSITSPSSVFQPIASIDVDLTTSYETCSESSKLKRKLFGRSRSHCFESSNSCESACVSPDSSLLNITPRDPTQVIPDSHCISDTSNLNSASKGKSPSCEPPVTLTSNAPHRTINESLKEIFKRFKKFPSDDSNTKKRNIQILLTPPDKPIHESLYLTLDDEGNETQTNSNNSTNKKGYIYSVISSLTNIIGKQNKDKLFPMDTCENDHNDEPLSTDVIKRASTEITNEVVHDSSPASIAQSVPFPKRLFTLFNSETIVTDSAFTQLATLKKLDDTKQPVKSGNTKVDCELKNVKDDKSSIEKVREIKESKFDTKSTEQQSQGYVADDAMSSDDGHTSWECIGANKVLKRRRNSKRSSKMRSGESSGFDEDTSLIKCPLGKNCTMRHDLNELELHNKPKIYSQKNDHVVLTHDHYAYMMQQFSSLRNQVNKGFEYQQERESNLIERLLTKVSLTNQDVLSNKLEIMELKLKEKEAEITRLRETVSHYEQIKNTKETKS